MTPVGVEDGKRMRTTIGVIHDDEHVRENDRRLIARRRSVFDWQDKAEPGR